MAKKNRSLVALFSLAVILGTLAVGAQTQENPNLYVGNESGSVELPPSVSWWELYFG